MAHRLDDLGLISHPFGSAEYFDLLTDQKSADTSNSMTNGFDASASMEAALRCLLLRQQELDAHRDEERRSLEQAVRSLIDACAPVADTAQPDVRVSVVTRDDEVAAAMSELSDSARETVSVMHPSPVPAPLDLRHTLLADRRLIERGIRVRRLNQLRSSTSAESTAGGTHLAEIGVELRLAPVVPAHLVIADRDMAVLPVDPEDPRRGMVVLRGAPLVRACAALFDQVWRDACAHDAVQPCGESTKLTEEQRAIARMLAAGDSDKRIARVLGVSQRTMSRKIADLMLHLQADTRFAAGVRAAQLHLLGPTGPTVPFPRQETPLS